MISHAAVLGWLYSVAPNRLCTSYLFDQQAALGTALFVIAAGLLFGLAWFAVVGPPGTRAEPQSGKAAQFDGVESWYR